MNLVDGARKDAALDREALAQVADLEESLAKAEALGGKRVMERIDIPDRPSIAQAADPEGNVIGLVQQ